MVWQNIKTERSKAQRGRMAEAIEAFFRYEVLDGERNSSKRKARKQALSSAKFTSFINKVEEDLYFSAESPEAYNDLNTLPYRMSNMVRSCTSQDYIDRHHNSNIVKSLDRWLHFLEKQRSSRDRVYEPDPEAEERVNDLLEFISVEEYLDIKHSHSEEINNNMSSHRRYFIAELVKYLVYAENWDDVKLICDRIQFIEADLFDSDTPIDEDLYIPSKKLIQTGVLPYLMVRQAPLFILEDLLEVVPHHSIKGNSGLFFLRSAAHSYNLKHSKGTEGYTLFRRILAANPAALVEPIAYVDSPFGDGRQNILAHIMYEVQSKDKKLCKQQGGVLSNRVDRYIFTFIARQFRAIKEVSATSSRSTTLDKQLFHSFVVPFISNPAYDLKNVNSNGDSVLTLFSKKMLHCFENVENSFDTDRILIKILSDFLPGSVYNEGTKCNKTVFTFFLKDNLAGTENGSFPYGFVFENGFSHV